MERPGQRPHKLEEALTAAIDGRRAAEEECLEAATRAAGAEERLAKAERLAAGRQAEPRDDDMRARQQECVEKDMPQRLAAGDAADLHAAAGEGRLADLGAGLTAKGAEGTLAAGAPRRAPPTSPCPLSPAPGRRGGRARRGGAR